VPFLSLHRGHGTAYHLPSELFHPSPPFGNNWRHICLGSVSANFLLTCYYDSVMCPSIVRVTASLKSLIGTFLIIIIIICWLNGASRRKNFPENIHKLLTGTAFSDLIRALNEMRKRIAKAHSTSWTTCLWRGYYSANFK